MGLLTTLKPIIYRIIEQCFEYSFLIVVRPAVTSNEGGPLDDFVEVSDRVNSVKFIHEYMDW